MKRCLSILLAATTFFPVLGLTSCASNAELEERLERRNENYSRYQDRRQIRSNAMDERYRTRYDRIMN